MADEQVIVDRDDVRVMFRRAAYEQDAITRAWAEVEGAVRSLKGRRFYGVFDPATSDYRACVQWRDGDDAAALGLEEGTLQGGRYARARLEGGPPAVYGLIKPAFERLAERTDWDPTRPSIEYYRRRDLIDVLLPVR